MGIYDCLLMGKNKKGGRVMFKFVSKKSKKEEFEKEYFEILKAFRTDFPVSEGWEINTFKTKDGLVTTKIQKNGKIFAQASVEQEDESLTDAERRSIIEALIRFGIIPT
ncbi:hypothetical protein [Deferribacter abyssi]|uniref:hypothetical protein n=1 Tax=Deferribacter abyssi TaxID=213806 RepID=UPI003C1320F8